MPRKLIAAQAVVVIGLVALIYFTLLRPDEGGPPRVVDAPGETQAQAPNEPPETRDPRDGGSDGRGGPGARQGGNTPSPRAGGATAPGDRPGARSPGTPGGPTAPSPDGPSAPADPFGPGGGAPPGLGGDGGYGPGDDQYGNSITRLEDRIGFGSDPLTP